MHQVWGDFFFWQFWHFLIGFLYGINSNMKNHPSKDFVLIRRMEGDKNYPLKLLWKLRVERVFNLYEKWEILPKCLAVSLAIVWNSHLQCIYYYFYPYMKGTKTYIITLFLALAGNFLLYQSCCWVFTQQNNIDHEPTYLPRFLHQHEG